MRILLDSDEPSNKLDRLRSNRRVYVTHNLPNSKIVTCLNNRAKTKIHHFPLVNRNAMPYVPLKNLSIPTNFISNNGNSPITNKLFSISNEWNEWNGWTVKTTY